MADIRILCDCKTFSHFTLTHTRLYVAILKHKKMHGTVWKLFRNFLISVLLWRPSMMMMMIIRSPIDMWNLNFDNRRDLSQWKLNSFFPLLRWQRLAKKCDILFDFFGWDWAIDFFRGLDSKRLAFDDICSDYPKAWPPLSISTSHTGRKKNKI
jgi:hypothetical protein